MSPPWRALVWLGIALVATLPSVAPAEPALASDFVLAAHADVGTAALPRADLKRILSGRQREWPDGTPVQLVLPPRKAESVRWMSKNVLKMPEDVYRRYLAEQVFRGAMTAPEDAEDAVDTVDRIASTSGAIGPIPRDALADGVHVVVVED